MTLRDALESINDLGNYVACSNADDEDALDLLTHTEQGGRDTYLIERTSEIRDRDGVLMPGAEGYEITPLNDAGYRPTSRDEVILLVPVERYEHYLAAA